MADALHLVICTSAVGILTGFGLGLYAGRGYLISPELKAERHGNLHDPVESEESDVDEEDTILDHAPNWSNGVEADRRQGLRQRQQVAKKQLQRTAEPEKEKQPAPEAVKEEAEPEQAPITDTDKEECKLVLVVRTDLGMTKGTPLPPPAVPTLTSTL